MYSLLRCCVSGLFSQGWIRHLMLTCDGWDYDELSHPRAFRIRAHECWKSTGLFFHVCSPGLSEEPEWGQIQVVERCRSPKRTPRGGAVGRFVRSSLNYLFINWFSCRNAHAIYQVKLKKRIKNVKTGHFFFIIHPSTKAWCCTSNLKPVFFFFSVLAPWESESLSCLSSVAV